MFSLPHQDKIEPVRCRYNRLACRRGSLPQCATLLSITCTYHCTFRPQAKTFFGVKSASDISNAQRDCSGQVDGWQNLLGYSFSFSRNLQIVFDSPCKFSAGCGACRERRYMLHSCSVPTWSNYLRQQYQKWIKMILFVLYQCSSHLWAWAPPEPQPSAPIRNHNSLGTCTTETILQLHKGQPTQHTRLFYWK
jgi:hypothetical protein